MPDRPSGYTGKVQNTSKSTVGFNFTRSPTIISFKISLYTRLQGLTYRTILQDGTQIVKLKKHNTEEEPSHYFHPCGVNCQGNVILRHRRNIIRMMVCTANI